MREVLTRVWITVGLILLGTAAFLGFIILVRFLFVHHLDWILAVVPTLTALVMWIYLVPAKNIYNHLKEK